MTSVLMRRSDTDTHIGRTPCDDMGRSWSDAATSQGKPTVAHDHQKPRRSKEGLFLRDFRGKKALLTP